MIWKPTPPKLPGTYLVRIVRDLPLVEKTLEVEATYYGPKQGWSLINDLSKCITHYREKKSLDNKPHMLNLD